MREALLAIGMFLTGGVAVGETAYLYTEYRRFELAEELEAAHARASEAEQYRDALVSGGRFVRQYDPKTGASIYTFAPPRTGAKQ
jgi:hypothetical protein